MPLYEYECEACGNRFEKIQKFSDPLEKTCPKCAGPVHKLMSSPAIQFKGSGWYITDYARKNGAAKDAKDGSASAKDAKTGETPTESKPPTDSPGENKSATPPAPAAATASKDSKP